MALKIVNPAQLVGQPALAARYGGKVAGLVKLHGARPGAPVPFAIPESRAIPSLKNSDITSEDVRQVFHDLTAGLHERSVLIARSSAHDESTSSGRHPSYCIAFDPMDKQTSFSRFLTEVDRLRNLSDDMNVLAMPMVGTNRQFADGDVGIGYDGLGFVADTHDPFAWSDMHIALVHGHAMRAVGQYPDYMPLTANRTTGRVTHFGLRSAVANERVAGSVTPIDSMWMYRQQRANYYSFVAQDFVERALDPSLEENRHSAIVLTIDGVLNLYRFHEEVIADGEYLSDFGPVQNIGMLTGLISLLQYFAAALGPGQIEGGFLTRNEERPYLFQWLDVPAAQSDPTPLTVDATQSVLRSEHVIGKGTFEGPLIWMPYIFFDQERALRQLDARYADTGYILLVNRHHRKVIDVTPHCKLRLARFGENPSSHVMTDVRLQIAEDPTQDQLLALQVKGEYEKPEDGIGGHHPGENYFGALIYERARLESNGHKMGLQIVKREPRSLWRDMWRRFGW